MNNEGGPESSNEIILEKCTLKMNSVPPNTCLAGWSALFLWLVSLFAQSQHPGILEFLIFALFCWNVLPTSMWSTSYNPPARLFITQVPFSRLMQ